jgi:hypothetical protein
MQIMKTLSKAFVGTIAAGAMVVASASPVLAKDRNFRDRDGISAGDVIAGALVIGGIAAIAAAASNADHADRDYDGYRYDRAGYGWDDRGSDWAYGGNPRQAVEQCIYTAERNAARYSYGRADVTDIRQVRDTRFGYEVRGRIAVNTTGRGWRSGDGTYGRGWGGDYRGWSSNLRGYDSGSFTCRYERGRVVDLDYSGLRGL